MGPVIRKACPAWQEDALVMLAPCKFDNMFTSFYIFIY